MKCKRLPVPGLQVAENALCGGAKSLSKFLLLMAVLHFAGPSFAARAVRILASGCKEQTHLEEGFYAPAQEKDGRARPSNVLKKLITKSF